MRDMIEPLGLEVCGAAPEAAVDQLRRETAAVPGAELTVLPISIGGLLARPSLKSAPGGAVMASSAVHEILSAAKTCEAVARPRRTTPHPRDRCLRVAD